MIEEKSLKLKEFVAIGGLLHDIGKPYQRSRFDTSNKDHSVLGSEFLSNLKSYLKVYSIFARYHHSDHLRDLESENLDSLRDVLSEEAKRRFADLSYEELLSLLKVVAKADNISSSEREKGEFSGKFWQVRMTPPFLKIELSNEELSSKYGYEIEPMDYNVPNYPKPLKDLPTDTKGEYHSLMNSLREELKSFKRVSYPYNVNYLALLLERYFSFVPSYTAKLEGEVSTHISLYDHLRSTSAIAVSLLDYLLAKDNENLTVKLSASEKPFLLVMIDISGIQKFIYDVSTTFALKNLRARSLYLNLILEDVVNEILSRLDYPRVNALYIGGGRGLLLLANTTKVVDTLRNTYRELQEWAVKEWGGEIAILLAWLEVSEGELSKAFNQEIGELNLKLAEEKYQKFRDVPEILLEDISRVPKEDTFTCEVCKERFPISLREIYKIGEEERELCFKCKLLTEIGRSLPNVKGFAFLEDCVEEALMTPFSKVKPVYNEKSVSKYLKEGTLKLLVMRPDFISSQLEPFEVNVAPLLLSEKVAAKSNGEVKEFSELASEAQGVKRIGVLRMDVDNLGFIFSELKRPSEYSTLSRLLSMFFQRYIDYVLREEDVALEGIVGGKNLENVTVIYSGGDDLFIVGAWNEVLEAAFRIERSFKKYVAYADKVTISGGYGIFDEKYPIYKLSLEVGHRLDNLAKEEAGGTKNRIALTDFRYESEEQRKFLWKSFSWSEFTENWQTYGSFLLRAITQGCDRGNGRERLSRAVIFKLLRLWEQYLRDHLSQRDMKFKWITELAYLLARAKCGRIYLSSERRFKELLKVRAEDLKIGHRFFRLGAVFKFVELFTRGKGGERSE